VPSISIRFFNTPRITTQTRSEVSLLSRSSAHASSRALISRSMSFETHVLWAAFVQIQSSTSSLHLRYEIQGFNTGFVDDGPRTALFKRHTPPLLFLKDLEQQVLYHGSTLRSRSQTTNVYTGASVKEIVASP
jgi:hypothetical protein